MKTDSFPSVTKLFLLLLMICVPAVSLAQLEIKSEVNRPSAQVSDYTRFGKYDPQLYSGRMSVNIPLYTLSDEDFTIPISLDYNYNGFIPNFQASEVGLGWSISCGGFITREVRGLPDEGFAILSMQSNLDRDLYGFDFLSQQEKVGYQNADIRYHYLEDETSPENILRFYIFSPNGDCYDATPDIYHFTFLGRSGSFVIDSNTGQFKAYNTSTFDGDYKIEKNTYTSSNGGYLHPTSFIITTSDGYRYIFGDSSEYSYSTYTERKALIRSASVSQEEIHLYNYPAIAWALREIIAPNGRTVYFMYNGSKDFVDSNIGSESKDNIVDFNETVYSVSPSLWGGGLSTYGIWSAESNIQPHEQLNSKCRLTSIVGDSFELNFHYEEKLPNQVSLYNKSGSATPLSNGYIPMLSSVTDSEGNQIANLTYTYNPNGNPYPFLTKVDLSERGKYTFEYKEIDTRYLPPMGTVATDHWGYLRSSESSGCNVFTFNSNSVGVQDSNYDETLPSLRTPSFSASSVGLMSKISYPTGGYSTFQWEPNYYRVALRKRSQNEFHPKLDTLSQTQMGPGGRIVKIVNYDLNGMAIDSTHYNYITDSGTESGVLLRHPRYSISYNGTLKGNPYSFYYVTTGGLNSFDAIAVEYPVVEEVLNDGSRVIHHFSSYYTHPDMFVQSRYPMPRRVGTGLVSYTNMTNVVVNDATKVSNILRPTTSHQIIRGKLIKQVILDNNLDTIKKVENSFLNTASYLPHYVYVGEAFSDVGIYSGGCYPFTTSATDYLNDNTTQTTSTQYVYNELGQTTQVVQKLNNGDLLTTIYRYAPDMITETLGNTIYHNMIKDNVIAYPIEVEQSVQKSGEKVGALLSKERYTFERFTTATDTSLHYYKPIRIERYDTKTGEFYHFATLEYDTTTGYLNKKRDANGSITLYEWSPLGVTKIIENAQEPVSNRMVWEFAYYKHNLPSTLKDPSGREIFYTYDSQDRLISATNSKGEKVEEYYYNTITQ